jgi:hypothetical protein
MMKLIFCPKCQDVFKLHREMKFCHCKTVFGRYHEDGLHAIVSRHAIVLGFDNLSLAKALEEKLGVPLSKFDLRKERKPYDKSIKLEAFIIPDDARTVEIDSEKDPPE